MRRILGVSCVLVIAASAGADDRIQVEFESELHFDAPEAAAASDIRVPAGRYEVEAEGPASLRLDRAGAKSLTIRAARVEHEEPIDAPVAVLVDSEEGVLLRLFLPGGESLEAIGTADAVRSRATVRTFSTQRVRLESNQLAAQRLQTHAERVQQALPGRRPDGAHTLAIPAAAFIFGGQRIERDYPFHNAGYYLRAYGGSEITKVDVVAPVQLPQGALVRSLTLHYEDRHPQKEIRVDLRRARHGFGGLKVLAEATSPGDSGFGSRRTDSIDEPTIDNANYRYWLDGKIPRAGYSQAGRAEDLELFSVVITYDLP
jgi:hypothetical protein